MSKEGIQVAAKLFSVMQETRQELLRMGADRRADGSSVASTREGQQDILLAHMFDHAKDAIKDDFCRIIEGKLPLHRTGF